VGAGKEQGKARPHGRGCTPGSAPLNVCEMEHSMTLLAHTMRRLVSRTAIEDAGQSMVEYALILAIVSIAAVGALALLGPQVVNAINAVTAAF